MKWKETKIPADNRVMIFVNSGGDAQSFRGKRADFAIDDWVTNMSVMIKCDKCKKTMYSDSRSDKDAYAAISTDYIDGHSAMHLCKTCFRQFLTEFMRTWTPEEFDEMLGE